MTLRTMHRLREERGATLSMALLVVLVCTFVASIVIVAGTSVAGRLTELRETNRAYYSVTSAAGYFSDMLSSNSYTDDRITISLSCNIVETSTDSGYTYAVCSTSKGDPYGEGWDIERRVNGVEVENITDSTLFLNLGLDYLFGLYDSVSDDGTYIGYPLWEDRSEQISHLTTDTSEETSVANLFDPPSGVTDASVLEFADPISTKVPITYEPFEMTVTLDSETLDTLVEVNLDSSGDIYFTFTDKNRERSTMSLRAIADVEGKNNRFQLLAEDLANGKRYYKFSTDFDISWTGGEASL